VNFRTALLLICGVAVAGCAGPMGQREAEVRANRSLNDFCRNAACGAARLIKTQKIKDRWLVDFETQAGLYTVTVDRSGAAKVSVWDKNPAR
jgi:diaminopimelate epimerase